MRYVIFGATKALIFSLFVNAFMYCYWFQVELTSTWNPHTQCMHGNVNTETYPRLDSGRQFGGHKLTT